MSPRKALITGITGQDGSYLAELLLSKGYQVHGMIRRVALEDPGRKLVRIAHLLDSIHLHPGSLESFPSVYQIFREVQPDECYHLAAQSFVSYSFEDEFSTLNTNINGTHFVISALKDIVPKCRFYFAGSSEMFGNVGVVPQSETTPFHPRSAYGISKVAGFHITRNYREAYGLHATSGILFNHESPRRGYEFVTRKITSGIAGILAGKSTHLHLGNLDARRDWGHARDYVEGIWMMVQQDQPGDYVLATGETHSVREFVDVAFQLAALDPAKHLVIESQLFRPSEVHILMGDATLARQTLGWSNRVSFADLVKEMLVADCAGLGIQLPPPSLAGS